MAGLRSMIAEGRFKPGDWLPAEQALAELFDVSRGTLRAALSQVQKEGLIETQPYRGRRVVGAPQEQAGVLADTVVLLSQSTELTRSLQQPPPRGYMAAADEAAVQAIHKAGLHVLTLDPHGSHEQAIDKLLGGRPAGVCISHQLGEEEGGQTLLRRLREADIPTVLNGNEPEAAQYDRVSSDHAAGAGLLTRWLLAQGRRRILRLWVMPHRYWVASRSQGHEQVMREADLEPLPAIDLPPIMPRRPGDDDEAAFQTQVRQVAGFLLEPLKGPAPVDAIMVASDGLVRPVAEACRLCGAEPGRDVLIVGYDNYYNVPSWETPYSDARPAATVDKRNEMIGQQMVKLLLDRIAGKLESDPEHVVVEPELVVVDRQ